MMGRLQEAVNMAEERKAAALGVRLEDIDHSEENPRGFVDDTTAAHLFLGWELDPQEIMIIPHDMGWGLLKSQAAHVTLPAMLSGAWVDGLLTGLLFNQIKEDS